jgi:hypothetical protein
MLFADQHDIFQNLDSDYMPTKIADYCLEYPSKDTEIPFEVRCTDCYGRRSYRKLNAEQLQDCLASGCDPACGLNQRKFEISCR